jgi:secretion/DNA translocation related TadE-like protein
MLGVALAIVMVFLAVAALASVTIASHRARAAADLGALAAASEVGAGGSQAQACTRTAEVVRLNQANLVGCRWLADGSVEVTTARSWAGPWPDRPPATARARAGPVSPAP